MQNDKTTRPNPERNNTAQETDGQKSLDWPRCPRHGINYPKGGKCPRCEREKQR